MSGTLSQIPELRYDDLVDEARARLPSLCPEWTDHGPADVGVTLIELFAALTEMVRYRTRRETEAMTRAFLELLAGPETARAPDLAAATRAALADVWTPYRAVTPDDYEALALGTWPESQEALALAGKAALRRVRCLADRDIAAAGEAPAPGHVTLVVLPDPGNDGVFEPLRRFFEPRRILTTRLHVVAPSPVKILVDAAIYVDDDASPATVRARVEAALADWFDPYTGGVDGDGWPFGAEVFVSDLYALLDGVSGVDFVTDIGARSAAPPARTLAAGDGAAIGLRLAPHEQPAFTLAGSKLRVFEPTSEGWKEIAP